MTLRRKKKKNKLMVGDRKRKLNGEAQIGKIWKKK